jgi:pimeloyl-ACP methyl ester carboxylesterase
MLAATSKDGTKIVYEKTGQGPALIVVNGALTVRGAVASLAGLLSSRFTVFCYDRRGRGGSGDTLPYSVEKEIEDLEALIDIAGGRASLYGGSSGGALAFEAALRLGHKVQKLAVYEVPYDSSEAGVKGWREYSAKLDGLLAEGRKGDAIVLFFEFIGAPKEMIEGMRKAPAWKATEAMGHTLAYDGAILGESRRPPIDRAARLSIPTLVMEGAASMAVMPFMHATAEALARAIPEAQHHILAGQRHDVDPEVMARELTDFLTLSEPSATGRLSGSRLFP